MQILLFLSGTLQLLQGFDSGVFNRGNQGCKEVKLQQFLKLPYLVTLSVYFDVLYLVSILILDHFYLINLRILLTGMRKIFSPGQLTTVGGLYRLTQK